MPETDFDMDKFIAEVKKVYAEKGNCMVAVSEGIHYADGSSVRLNSLVLQTYLPPSVQRSKPTILSVRPATAFSTAALPGDRRQGPRHRAEPAPALRRAPGLPDRYR